MIHFERDMSFFFLSLDWGGNDCENEGRDREEGKQDHDNPVNKPGWRERKRERGEISPKSIGTKREGREVEKWMRS